MANSKGIRAGRAFVELGTDNSKLSKGLKAAQARLKSFGAGVGDVGKKLTAVSGAILAPLAGSAKIFSSMGDEVAKMSKRTGFATESLSQLSFAAQQSGTNFEDVEKSIRKMQRSTYDASRGLSTTVDALADLGLTSQDLEGLLPEEQFKLLADKISQVEDPTKKAAIAMTLFGRTGTNLLPMFANGAKGIEELMQEADRLGLTIGGKDAKAAEDFTDAIGRLTKTAKMASFSVGAALGPALSSVADSLTKTVVKIIGWVKENRSLIVTVAKVAAGVGAAGIALMAMGQAAFFASFALKGIMLMAGVISSPIIAIVGAIAALGAIFAYVGLEGDSFAQKMASLKDMVMPAIAKATEFIKSAWSGVVSFVTPILSAWVSLIKAQFNLISSVVSKAMTAIQGYISKAWDFIGPTVMTALNWMKEAVITAFAASAFVIENFGLVVDVTIASAAYAIVKFASQVQYFFTKAIPGYLSWFANNWRDVFTTIFNGVKSFAVNVGRNLANLWNAIIGLMRGEGWNFQWTGLLEGFESTIKEMPKIAERQIGPLEKQLSDDLNGLMDELSSEWNDYRKSFGVTGEIKDPPIAKVVDESSNIAEEIVDASEAAANILKDVEVKSIGTFNASAIQGLQTNATDDRIAKATEETSKNTKTIARGMGNGLVFG